MYGVGLVEFMLVGFAFTEAGKAHRGRLGSPELLLDRTHITSKKLVFGAFPKN
jgi:hypothetical protein